MLTLKVPDADDIDHISFELYLNETCLAKFDWPVMSTSKLKKIIAGEDCTDQDDEGVKVTVTNKVVNIRLDRAKDDCEAVEFNLPCELFAKSEIADHMLLVYKRFWDIQGGEPEDGLYEECFDPCEGSDE